MAKGPNIPQPIIELLNGKEVYVLFSIPGNTFRDLMLKSSNAEIVDYQGLDCYIMDLDRTMGGDVYAYLRATRKQIEDGITI